MFETMMATGESFEIENRYIRKDGSLVWVANSVSGLRDESGRIRRVASVVTDITERKQAQQVEQRLAAIIASSDEAILSTDLNMVITSWNTGAERLYGHSAEEAIGRSVMMLVPDDRSEEEPAILAQIRAGQKVEPYETKRRCKNGELVDVLLSVSPIYDAYGRIIGASKIAHDISAKKEAERLQTVLVGELNHRVKNVLATVMAIARQTLGRDDVDKASVETFEARLSSMARAHDLLIHGHWEQAELTAVIAQALSPIPRTGSKFPDRQSNSRRELSFPYRLRCMSLRQMPPNTVRFRWRMAVLRSCGHWKRAGRITSNCAGRNREGQS